MSTLKKGSVVWYYDTVLNEWRRGQVLAVNRYSLTIKKRHKVYAGSAKYRGRVITADQPKPTVLPEELEMVIRLKSGYSRYWEEHYGTTWYAYKLTKGDTL